MDYPIGYSYNADTFCDDCTKDYIIDQVVDLHTNAKETQELSDMFNIDDYNYYVQSFRDYIEEQFEWSNFEKLTNLIKDNEGNDVHPIFENDELLDHSDYCSNVTYHLNEDGDIKQLKEANEFTNQFLGELYEKLDCLSFNSMKQQIIFEASYDWNLKFTDEREQNRQLAIIEYIEGQVKQILNSGLHPTFQWIFYQQEHDHSKCEEDHNLIIKITKIDE